MAYGIEIAIAALVGAAIGSGSAAARGAEGKEIALSGLAGAAIGAATSGVGTLFQSGGQAAASGAQAATQGAASGAAGGAASGAGGAVASGAAGAAGEASGEAAFSGALFDLLGSGEVGAEAGTGIGAGALEAGVQSSAIPAANTAGMELWPSIPQYMRYGGEHGGLFNQANYLVEGAYNYPGVQTGITAGRYGSGAVSAVNNLNPVGQPNFQQAFSGIMPTSRQGISFAKDWQQQQQQAQQSQVSIGSSLGQGWDPESPDYWNKNSLWGIGG